MILKNSILCLHCDTEAISKHGHDMTWCECGKVAADGGNNYLRRCGDNIDWIDSSIIDDGKHETRRKYLRWSRNYDENMNRLSETEWITIENMSTDHIQAILDGGYSSNNVFFTELFKEELNFRNK